MVARISMLLKSRASLICFRGCFLPGRAKDLSEPGIQTFCLRRFSSVSGIDFTNSYKSISFYGMLYVSSNVSVVETIHTCSECTQWE